MHRDIRFVRDCSPLSVRHVHDVEIFPEYVRSILPLQRVNGINIVVGKRAEQTPQSIVALRGGSQEIERLPRQYQRHRLTKSAGRQR